MSKGFSSRHAFFEFLGGTVERCWALGASCDEPAIRAHSVQNARYLDLLVRDGHVVEFTLDFSSGKPRGVFRQTGRNRATTFEGLCARHDTEIFRPIDTTELDLANPRHLFLLAYCAVMREAHTSAKVGVKSYELYVKHVEAGLVPGDRPSPMGVFAVQRLMVTYETFMYKLELDQAYLAGDFSMLDHDVLVLDGVRPSLGASALFSLEDVTRDDEMVRASLTILPLDETQTIAVLSYTHRDAEAMRTALRKVLEANGLEQMQGLSRLLLNSCENFVLAPDFYDTWPEDKREAIAEYVVGTVFKDDFGVDDDRLLVFWEVP